MPQEVLSGFSRFLRDTLDWRVLQKWVSLVSQLPQALSVDPRFLNPADYSA